jgi:hypothetical protein
MAIDEYLETELQNFQRMRTMPHYRELIPLLDSLYVEGIDLIPAASPPYFGRLLLVCHKSLLGAASLLLRLHPDDAGPVTRRSIEAVLIAAAVKHDPANLAEWQSFEERTKRWDARQEGQKPKPLRPSITYPETEQVERLWSQLGMLSDAYVHFTPEFMLNLDWRNADVDDGTVSVHLNYFTKDRPQVEREMVTLAGVHSATLDIFDTCYDRTFQANRRWASLRRLLDIRGAQLASMLPRPSAPSDGDKTDTVDPRGQTGK